MMIFLHMCAVVVLGETEDLRLNFRACSLTWRRRFAVEQRLQPFEGMIRSHKATYCLSVPFHSRRCVACQAAAQKYINVERLLPSLPLLHCACCCPDMFRVFQETGTSRIVEVGLCCILDSQGV